MTSLAPVPLSDGQLEVAVMRLVDRYRLGGIATVFNLDTGTVTRVDCEVRGLARLAAAHPENVQWGDAGPVRVGLIVGGRDVAFKAGQR